MADIQADNYIYFLSEAQDLLRTIEAELINLRSQRSQPKVYGLMRATHTLKGAAAIVSQATIQNISHQLESFFQALLDPGVAIDAELESLLFQGYECLRAALAAEMRADKTSLDQINSQSQVIFDQITAKLGDALHKTNAIPSSAELGFDLTKSVFEVGVKEKIDHLAAVARRGNSREIVDQFIQGADVFLGLGESLGLAGFQSLANHIKQAFSYHPEQAQEIAGVALADLQAAYGSVMAGDRQQGGHPSPQLQAWATPPQQSSGLEELSSNEQALAELFGDVDLDANTHEYVSEDLSLEVTPEPGIDPAQPWQIIEAPAELLNPGDLPPQKNPILPSTLRVELEQLEQQSYLAGELLINQNQLALQGLQTEAVLQKLAQWLKKHRQSLLQFKLLTYAPDQSYAQLGDMLDTALEEVVQMEQASADLQLSNQSNQQLLDREQRLLKQMRESMQATRMMPIGNVLSRLSLITQQLTNVYNKPVELKLRGLDVLIDKAIADNLYEALLHLVRNAFAHGIEPPLVRQSRGKLSVGLIEVNAYHQGNRTVIEVRDDGQGIDIDHVLNRARHLNLITASQAARIKASPQTGLLELLCLPGMSTQTAVDDLAGRGIGLDVVRSQLQSIQGTISLTSQPGQGTAFIIQIREALISARLLSCRAGGRVYAFVANEIAQTLMPFGDEFKTTSGQRVLSWGNPPTSIPIYHLAELFNYPDDRPPPAEHQEIIPLLTPRQGRTPVLLLPKDESFIGLEVDQVIEEQELVIKPVPMAIASPDYVYGCTVLADGSMTLVIDGIALVNYTQTQAIPEPSSVLQPLLPAADPDLKNITKNILIVDDSITERQKLSLVLQKNHLSVQQAKDGVDALEQLQQNAEVALIICDLEMPRMNGFEFLSTLKQHSQLNQIPVVMLTSRGSEQYRQIAASLGATAYLTKPYLEQQLLSTIHRIIGV